MQNIIKIGIGVMLLDDDKVLLGHRATNKKDTGGTYETDCWTLPGGKQEYDETIDIWSLGVLLYELVHSYSPFFSEDLDVKKIGNNMNTKWQ